MKLRSKIASISIATSFALSLQHQHLQVLSAVAALLSLKPLLIPVLKNSLEQLGTP